MKNKLWEVISGNNDILDGVYCACTANEVVLRAVLNKALETNTLAVIEATANQVDQYGGYTGMKPVDFKNMVYRLADEVGFDKKNIILGGDHLGPLTFAHLGEEKAMEESRVLVREYVKAGFTKIHIDTSMRIKGDSETEKLSDDVIARRGSELLRVCVDTYKEFGLDNPIVYIIGSEVPIPGGAQEEEEMHVTEVEDFKKTIETFKFHMEKQDVLEVYDNVIGVVVQPGVEFADAEVDRYNRDKAKELTNSLKDYPNKCFEGHSTDYQSKYALKEMVEDGIKILKVGPGLTFAYREALFGLSMIESLIYSKEDASNFIEVLEDVMVKNPGKWQVYYHGNELELKTKRAYSFSDRVRYYLPYPEVDSAVSKLKSNLDNVEIPLNLLSQYFPVQYRKIIEGELAHTFDSIVSDVIGIAIDDYIYAIKRS